MSKTEFLDFLRSFLASVLVFATATGFVVLWRFAYLKLRDGP